MGQGNGEVRGEDDAGEGSELQGGNCASGGEDRGRDVVGDYDAATFDLEIACTSVGGGAEGVGAGCTQELQGCASGDGDEEFGVVDRPMMSLDEMATVVSTGVSPVPPPGGVGGTGSS